MKRVFETSLQVIREFLKTEWMTPAVARAIVEELAARRREDSVTPDSTALAVLLEEATGRDIAQLARLAGTWPPEDPKLDVENLRS